MPNEANLANAMKNVIEELEAAIRFRQSEIENMQRCLAACKLIRSEDPDPIGSQLVADIAEELKVPPYSGPYRRRTLPQALASLRDPVKNGDPELRDEQPN
jgi:hypothetical protein